MAWQIKPNLRPDEWDTKDNPLPDANDYPMGYKILKWQDPDCTWFKIYIATVSKDGSQYWNKLSYSALPVGVHWNDEPYKIKAIDRNEINVVGSSAARVDWRALEEQYSVAVKSGTQNDYHISKRHNTAHHSLCNEMTILSYAPLRYWGCTPLDYYVDEKWCKECACIAGIWGSPRVREVGTTVLTSGTIQAAHIEEI